MVTSFISMGRVIYVVDENWLGVVWNLEKARTVWRWMTRILSREGARPQVSVFFFIAVVQSVLIFGEETWVVTPCMGRVMGGFQYQVEKQLTGQLPWRREYGKW